MTWILFLLCLAIAGRELYLAFERRRPAVPELAELRARLAELEGTRADPDGARAAWEERLALQDERLERLAATQVRQVESLDATDARIRSLVEQINDRMVPEVSARLARQREAIDRLDQEVARLRDHLVHRLEQAVATSLGADPVDMVAGALAASGTAETGADLARAYERLAARFGLHVELTAPAAYRAPGADGGEQTRYYLSGRSPRALESDFIDLFTAMRRASEDPLAPPAEDDTRLEAGRSLLAVLDRAGRGAVQIGPLVVAHTAESLVCGVLPLAELAKAEPAALVADPEATAERLRRLPEGRLHTWES